MSWKIFRIPKIEVGPPGLKVTAERVAPEREVLYPLIVTLSDKRAILDFYGRADTPYVTDSIRDLRTRSTTRSLRSARTPPRGRCSPASARPSTSI